MATMTSINGVQAAKRKRKPWVYKEDYDKLQAKYEDMRMVARIGWIMWALVTVLLLAI